MTELICIFFFLTMIVLMAARANKPKDKKDILFAVACYKNGKYYYEKSVAGLSAEEARSFIDKYESKK